MAINGSATDALRVWPWALNLLSMFGGGPQSYTPNCDYTQHVALGATYYIYSPGYDQGQTYPPNVACRWRATSPPSTRLRLHCTDFRLGGGGVDCGGSGGDALYVVLGAEGEGEPHCGEGAFSAESEGSAMAVIFRSDSRDHPMDRFLCSIRAFPMAPCECGRRNEMRIVGGIETGVNEFPMMAGLVDPVDRRVFCGATIVSSRYAVTAAHCLFEKDFPKGLGLLVGDHDLTSGSDTPSAKLYRISETVTHPDYVKQTMANDIAVVKVGTRDSEGIAFNDDVGPACLPFRFLTDTFTGDRVTALGWGTTSFGGEESNVLREAFLSVVGIQECSEAYKGNVGYRQICTFEEGSDACQSDSGGPILWLDRTSGRIHLLGVISYGVSCGGSAPGVNTRVTSYLDWIVLATNEAYCVA
ncbi:venom serine protease-like [Ischnura elegans]|uniref:venom serine protease-like n=1 Tax=Ischnura elegans TaxID=197161 RepID=UPI001ED8A32D|nr:venom serine protease-like [Ischnura elegans]